MSKPAKTIDPSNPLYSLLMGKVADLTEDKLIIVARSEDNKKDDRVKPIAVKNGLYFYAAYCLGDSLAFVADDMTPDKIEKAKENTAKRARISGGLSILVGGDSSIDDFTPTGDPMYIVTNDLKVDGAGILFCPDVLRKIKDKIGDFFIAPSSNHEIILTPVECGINLLDLTLMVREINATHVEPEEVLDNNAYHVDDWL